MKADEKFVELRCATRRASYMRAAIFHPLQTEHLGCVVRDISQDGALIDFPRAGNLPKLFWLRLEGEATLRLCTTAWRSEAQIGVEFSEQIMERRRVERWTQTRQAWSGFPARQQKAVPDISAANSAKWSASLVCLRA
jgi:PilZ domain